MSFAKGRSASPKPRGRAHELGKRPSTPPVAQPSWHHLAAFLAVMRTGSLSAGARTLGLSQPTMRRQIEALEQTLGTVLFTRSPLGLLPTETAQATLPYAESIASVAEALVRVVSGAANADEGTVRLTCSEVIGIEVLPPMLKALQDEHPRLQIELVPTNKNQDLLRRDADVAVRMVRPTEAGLVAQRVGVIEVGLFASESYLERHPLPRSAADLAHGHTLLGRDRDGNLLAVLARFGAQLEQHQFTFRSDSDVALLAALRAGIGIGPCQVPLAARSPSLRRLVPAIHFDMETWLVTHENLRSSKRISLVFEHLVHALGEYIAGGAPRKRSKK